MANPNAARLPTQTIIEANSAASASSNSPETKGKPGGLRTAFPSKGATSDILYPATFAGDLLGSSSFPDWDADHEVIVPPTSARAVSASDITDMK